MDYPQVLTFLLGILSIASALLAAYRGIENRLQALRSQQSAEYQHHQTEIHALKTQLGLNDQRDLSRLEMLEYRINGNTELINHRTQRFKEEVARVEAQVKEVRSFLEKTTAFRDRDRHGSPEKDTYG